LGSDGDVSLLPVVSLQVKSERWLGALFILLLRLGLSASAIGLLSVSVDFRISSAACSLDALLQRAHAASDRRARANAAMRKAAVRT
jgi:hypothetical protein